MQPDTLQQSSVQWVNRNKDSLIHMSRFIWENPELGYQEKKASALLASALEKGGFQVQRGTAGLETAFVAKHEGYTPGPTVALVAEYDALPGLGHACGHNLFCVSAVGAALALAESMEQIGGTILVVGSPAEEGVVPNAGGKHFLVRDGVFDGVDAAFICHAEDRTIIERSLNALRQLDFVFTGKPAHAGGTPWAGVNALNAATVTLHAMDCLRQHVLPSVRIHPILTEGGTLVNTVPERAVIKVGVRAPTNKLVEEVCDKLQNCAKGGALATGCTVDIKVARSSFDVRPNHSLGLAFKKALDDLGVPSEQAGAAGYAWDMGLVSYTVPSIDPYIKIGDEGLTGHTPEFTKAAGSEQGMEAMLTATRAMAITAAEFLTSKNLQEEVANEFRSFKETQAI